MWHAHGACIPRLIGAASTNTDIHSEEEASNPCILKRFPTTSATVAATDAATELATDVATEVVDFVSMDDGQVHACI